MMPQLLKPLELAAPAEVARFISGCSALFTARAALSADFRLAETLKHIQLSRRACGHGSGPPGAEGERSLNYADHRLEP